MTSANIGNSVKEIGEFAFEGCAELRSVSIDSKLLSTLGYQAFIYCDKVEKFNVPDIGVWCKIRCDILSNRAGCRLYLHGEEIQGDIVIPDNIEWIGRYAFYDCDKITSVTIPNSVKTIDDWAFADCDNLKSVNSSDIAAWCMISFWSYPLTNVGCKLYLNGEEISGDIVIPDNVTKIPDFAFDCCQEITSVTIPGSVTSIGSCSFSCCVKMAEINIPNSVTSIGSQAFYNCESLTKLEIPNTITSIENGTFYGCFGLKRINIPNSVTSIGWNAFACCTGVVSVTIPNSVTTIMDEAFATCSDLKEVDYDTTVPLVANANIFDDSTYKQATLYVAKGGMENARSTEPWRNFSNIQERDFANHPEITVDKTEESIDFNKPYDVYNAGGVKMGNSIDNQPAGIYILNQDGISHKFIVK